MPKLYVPLLEDNGQTDQTGEAVAADAQYGFSNGLHTVTAELENFTGHLYLEGTLSLSPNDSDWFPLYTNYSYAFARYPRDPDNPTGTDGDTLQEIWNFTGNFTAIRARVVRSTLSDPPADTGRVKRVMMSI